METVAVVGLGYVGLPLAVEFGKVQKTIGYDSDLEKVGNIRRGLDPAKELSSDEIRSANLLHITDDPASLNTADYIIIDVPTPVDTSHQPDLAPLIAATRTVGRHMRRGTTIIYESTVYPGATEEVCVPLLEKGANMKWRDDFHVAYSPERINPGDRKHTLANVTKVVAGDSPETLEAVARLYGRIVRAGVYRAPSIAVAEAAKVIENTQRDLNIALMNEFAIIFNRLGLDTLDVLQTAETKWNFLPFRPGLVGGHCVGVDPYYLTHKAEQIGYHPHVILAGRRINDSMGKYVAEQTIKHLIQAGRTVRGAHVGVLGITFKENVADLRNSRVLELIQELRHYGADVHIHDPILDPEVTQREHGLALVGWDRLPACDALILAVAHDVFRSKKPGDYLAKLQPGGCLMDVKAICDPLALRAHGVTVWRL